MDLRTIAAVVLVLILVIIGLAGWRHLSDGNRIKVISVTDNTGITYSVVYQGTNERGEMKSQYEAVTDDEIIEVTVYQKKK